MKQIRGKVRSFVCPFKAVHPRVSAGEQSDGRKFLKYAKKNDPVIIISPVYVICFRYSRRILILPNGLTNN